MPRPAREGGAVLPLTLDLAAIAGALGGRVRHDRTGPHVVAPGPGCKKRDRSLSVWINGDKIRVDSRRGVDWREAQDYVRRCCGMPEWKPSRKPKAPPKLVAFPERNMFVGESLKICRHRRRITLDQFALLLNDVRLAGLIDRAAIYGQEFGFTAADIERCMQIEPRHYRADERAEIFQIRYAERQALGLRRTGSIDVDKAGRERARRARYNKKRRAARKNAGADRVSNPPCESFALDTAFGVNRGVSMPAGCEVLHES
jgi:hypothetical protein